MRREFVTVSSQESLGEAQRIMRFARLRHLLVEHAGILVGILSYRDLVDRALGNTPVPRADGAIGDVAVAQAMVDSPYSVTPDAPLPDAANRMCKLGLGCLPVVEATDRGPRLVGLVTETDLLAAAYGPAWASP